MIEVVIRRSGCRSGSLTIEVVVVVIIIVVVVVAMVVFLYMMKW